MGGEDADIELLEDGYIDDALVSIKQYQKDIDIIAAEDEDKVTRLGIECCLHSLERFLSIELVNA